jgi:hypothetical protein
MRSLSYLWAILLGVLVFFAPLRTDLHAQSTSSQNIFHVKYIADGSVYIDGGRNSGLEEDMVLHVVHAAPNGGTTESVRFRKEDPIGDLRIFSVAGSSAACEITSSKEDFAVGDVAYLAPESIQKREDEKNTAESADYPVVVSFSHGDPLDEEIRETTVPQTMYRTDNQLRGRLGFDYGGIREPGGPHSNQVGLLLQADMSRIGGTHWNFTGYWRGRLNSQRSGGSGGVTPETINDLINRTYHLGLFYENPDSPITVGIGRLYLPWAPSLSTIDGGYLGRRFTQAITIGAFGGSTPDPTSWSYSPNQHLAGTFVNYEHGDFDHIHFSDTVGLAVTTQEWHVAREFAFVENTISFSRQFSFYNSLQADTARITPAGQQYNTGLSQSFSTLRYQPVQQITFSLNHNYFRNLPTFDPLLISTGLLDQYLFQGLSGGVRVVLPYRIELSTDLGRSKTSMDISQSWNQMYGIVLGDIGRTGLRLDLRYSKFNSSFGQGSYESASLTKNLTDKLLIQLQGGKQHLNSIFTTNSNSTFVTSLVDWSFGPRYFVESQFTWNTGTSLNDQQWSTTFGYRFGGYLRK